MTEQNDNLAAAMHELHSEVRNLVPVPDAAGLRAHATHRRRVRRATTTLVAVAAVAVVSFTGTVALRAAAPLETASTVGPTVVPSPRPAPRPLAPLDHPITDVDWPSASIYLSEQEGCPSGLTRFTPVGDGVGWSMGPPELFPSMLFKATEVAYGDLDGDGTPEVAMPATCMTAESGSQPGSRVAVMTRHADGTLSQLGWAGPDGVSQLSFWVSDARLLVSVDEWAVERSDGAEAPRIVPGQAFAYEWQDERGFVGGEPAAEYPLIVPVADGDSAAPVRPRAAIASSLGCPDRELRFAPAPTWEGDQRVDRYIASADDASYTITARAFPHLLDLDNTGIRLLVAPLACARADGTSAQGLAVFEPADGGWQGISIRMTETVGQAGGGTVIGDVPVEWELTEDGYLSVVWREADGDRTAGTIAYRWTGTELIAVDE